MKIRYIISICILCFIFSINCLANVSSENVFEYEDGKITVTFSENCSLSSEEKEHIAATLVYGESSTGTTVQPRSWCWLTGHDYIYNSVSAITHKVYASAPRCVEDLYTVTTCSKCDYEEIELLSTLNIYCCPEE